MNCFESDAKDKIKIPPAVSKAFMNEALDAIKGGKSYPEALDHLAQKSGFKVETVNTILRRDPKTFSLTKQAIAKAGDVRRIRDAAEGFAEQLKTDGKLQNEPGKIAKAWDLQRRIALGGHSPVFPWTHMRDWAVQIPTAAGRARMGAFWQAAGDVWKYRGEKGKALYEMDMGLMQKGDRYDFWKQSSADLVPGKRTPGDILLQNRKPSWQTRNFDALKPGRYTALEDEWSRLDPALKEGDTGKAMGAMIARDMNYATGSIMPPVGEAANMMAKTGAQLSQLAGHYNLLLSSKLFFAKHMNATFGPLRYLAKAGRMSPAERAASNIALKRWGNTVTTHLGILGVNYAFNKMMGWQTPNLTDPSKPDFLRVRLGNHVVPFSPMLEAIRLPIVATTAMLGNGSAGDKAWNAIWNSAHPAFHTLYEQATGKDYLGRPITASIRNAVAQVFPSTAPKVSKEKAANPVGPLEYASSKAPIAVAGALKEYYTELKTQGVNPSLATAIVKSAATGASSALFGLHVFELEPKKEKSTTTGLTRPMTQAGTRKPKPLP